MLPERSQRTFERFLAARNQRVANLTLAKGVDAMLAFYREVRAEGCDMASDGDVLLYQWGTHDKGRGRHFSLDISRQSILADGEDEDTWQLSLTFVFMPAPTLDALGAGNRWCRTLEEEDALRAFILSSPAYAAAAKMPLVRTALARAPRRHASSVMFVSWLQRRRDRTMWRG